MNMSTTVTKITTDFILAQAEIKSVIKDTENPFFKKKYADLTSVIEACKEQLNNNGIAILQPIDGMTVETILIHRSGEWFSSSTPIVCKEQNNPQALGSAITYAKRYGLQSMVLLPAEDDDGNSASAGKEEANATATLQENCVDCVKEGNKSPSIAPFVYEQSMREYGLSICFKHRADHEKIGGK